MAGNTVTYFVESDSLVLHPRNTASGITRALIKQDWGRAEDERQTQPAPYGLGVVELAPPTLTKARTVQHTLVSWCGSEAAAWSEHAMLKRLFRPHRPAGYLRQTWVDNSGTVTRDLYVRPVGRGAMSWPGDGKPEFIGNPAGGVIRFPLEFESYRSPLFQGTEQSSARSLTTSNQTFTLTNNGDWPIGIKAVLSSLVGTWTSITITNNTGGGPFSALVAGVTWTDSAFANTDYLSWKHDDVALVEWTSGNSISSPGTADIIVWPGDNTIQWIGVGGTTGTITFYWRELYF